MPEECLPTSRLKGDPLFLCGHPTSGTTLLLSLLDSHSDLLVFPEETDYLPFVRKRPDLRLEYFFQNTHVAHLLSGGSGGDHDVRDYQGIDPARFRARAEDYCTNWRKKSGHLLEALVFAYAEVIGRTEWRYWVEKTPLNEAGLPAAVQCWPSLKAVYIVRDPRDVYCSIRKSYEDPECPKRLDKFIAKWRRSVEFWQVWKESGSGVLLRYEDLALDVGTAMREVCNYLEIMWDPGLETPTRGGQFWAGNSSQTSRFQKVSRASLGRHKNELDSDKKLQIDSELEDLMRELGYL